MLSVCCFCYQSPPLSCQQKLLASSLRERPGGTMGEITQPLLAGLQSPAAVPREPCQPFLSQCLQWHCPKWYAHCEHQSTAIAAAFDKSGNDLSPFLLLKERGDSSPKFMFPSQGVCIWCQDVRVQNHRTTLVGHYSSRVPRGIDWGLLFELHCSPALSSLISASFPSSYRRCSEGHTLINTLQDYSLL